MKSIRITAVATKWKGIMDPTGLISHFCMTTTWVRGSVFQWTRDQFHSTEWFCVEIKL